MKILAYDVENFKGLRHVAITPDPNVVLVVGRNGAGKSSVIDAVFATLAGASASPEVPVRNGEQRARCELDLGDLRVVRTWASDGTTRLAVEDTVGARVRSPQGVLDSLMGHVGFDPLEFTRRQPAEQAKTLLRVAGLEATLDAFDAEAEQIRAERSEVARAIRADEGALLSYGDCDADGLGDDPPDPTAAEDAYREAVDRDAENKAKTYNAYKNNQTYNSLRLEAERLGREADRVRAELQRAVERAEDVRAAAEAARRAAEESAAAVEGIIRVDLDAFRASATEARAAVAKYRRRQERDAIRERWVGNREHSAGLTSKLTATEKARAAALQSASFPVPGLECTGTEVLLDGVPLRQANTAAQIRVGLEVAAALNPKLRVAAVRDGSLLDDDALAALWSWAMEKDYQVWIERVGNADAPTGVVIEAGAVVADRQFRAGAEPERGLF